MRRCHNIRNMLIICASGLFSVWAADAAAQSISAREIMTKIEKISRESSTSAIQKMKLMTCRYGKKAGKTVCLEEPRIKLVESVQIDCGENARDSKSVSFILEPIGEKGMGMLSYEFDAPDKDNISWLYLPAMGKVKKIISSDTDDDSGSSFFGSEFFLEDLENVDVDDFEYKLLKETEFRKRPGISEKPVTARPICG